MDSREIRYLFLDYFRKRGHEIVESSSLIPKEDPTLLFTNAGMVQFKRLFLGEEKRGYTKAATSQKCVRAGGKHNDLENVGYTPRHHTFFEMLGNFSFGDYFKKEAITWAWELLTEIYKLPTEHLYISVFEDDDEARGIWEREVGVPSERIIRLGEKDNFWAMGDTGPCGPCSEIHIDQGPSFGCGRPECAPGCDCDRFLEIWNLVFTQFDRGSDGKLTPLPKPNIDTGMGLERLAAVIQGVSSNYEIDLFREIIGLVSNLSGKNYGKGGKQDVAFRVISDHSRAASFLIGDGIMPSNEGRGYVLRRIIRRAIRFGQVIGLKDIFLHRICTRVIEIMGTDFNELLRSKSLIEGVIKNEEERFADTLHYSMKVLDEKIEELISQGSEIIPGSTVFKLYDTYGLAPDIVEDVAREENLRVDMNGFEEAMAKRKALSQQSWKGSGEEEIPEAFRKLLGQGLSTRFVGYDAFKIDAEVIALVIDGVEKEKAGAGAKAEVVLDRSPFYGQAGGQSGDTGEISSEHVKFIVKETLKYDQNLIVHKGYVESGVLLTGGKVNAMIDRERRKAAASNHTATHLLHAALREILGEHVKQAGSLVSSERLRFDFSHFTQVPRENLIEIERYVNKYIRKNLPVSTVEMPRQEAMKTGAMAIFEEKYGDDVRIVSIGKGVSNELCGGTHAERTGDIGLLRIIGESSVAANIRRIEALTGEAALEYDQNTDQELKFAASLLKTIPGKVGKRLEKLIKEQKEKEKSINALKAKLMTKKSHDFLSNVKEINGVKVIALEMEAGSPKELRESADKIKDKLRSGIVVLGARGEGKVMLTCMVTKDLINRFKAGDIIGKLSSMVGGKGGGRPDMAQGGGSNPEALKGALASLDQILVGMG
ncbi:alanine--tRNA ligase [Thermodesulfobacteriota bacterium]